MSGINVALTSVTDRAKKSKLAIKRMAKRWKAARASLNMTDNYPGNSQTAIPIGGGGGRSVTAKLDGAIGGGG